MNIDLDTGRLIVFVGGLFIFAIMERFMASRSATNSLGKRIALHSLIAAVNTTLVRILIYVPLLAWIVYVEQMGWGAARWLGLNGAAEFVVSIVVLDAFDYFWHRANHRIPFLWRFHKAHHSDNDLDVFTALRFHPGELFISSGVKAVWIVLWGPSAIAWFLFEMMVSLCAQMHHANLDLPDRIEKPLAKLWVTPRFHAAHHLVDRQYGDRNFSTLLSCWDTLFSSQAPWITHEGITQKVMGLPDAREQTLSPLQLLLEPLKTRNLSLGDRNTS
ncbi:MAG: sterol desaturase family protein [Gammaproteobacteria bacterium]|jgi:sterol desaturase/sphingolipid hydroxylase (fatty acid hydroxylase superfamily)|nr:sterol desaturase family protein [Gammaproteobacteria bacterium]